MRRFAPLAALLTAIIGFSFSGNTDLEGLLYQKAEEIRTKYPFEKVYLQFDKPFYATGDSICFKAYIVNAEKNLPSSLSNILYVDLIDEKDSVRTVLTLPVADGIAASILPIADTLEEGNYRIRAYTRWMRNFSEDHFFEQGIAIGNALDNDITMHSSIVDGNEAVNKKNLLLLQYQHYNGKPVSGKDIDYSFNIGTKEMLKGSGKTDSAGKVLINLTKLNQEKNNDWNLVTAVKSFNKKIASKSVHLNLAPANATLSFFPEGGHMVNGLPATLGFKAVDQYGRAVHVQGEIVGENNQPLTRFETGYAGMGSCRILPEAGIEYYAQARFDDGSVKKFPLPRADNNGYTLSVESAGSDKLQVRIASNLPEDEVTLVAQSNNIIEYVAKNKVAENGIYAALSKKRFPTGIVQFTLFNAAMQPVAERLVFVNNHDQLALAISTDKPVYKKREAVALKMEVKDPEAEIIKGSFSMAVTDISAVAYNEADAPSILSSLLLTGDLKGDIENPGYYFAKDNKQTQTDLDNLLLTQGWRRFSWKDILANKLPAVQFQPEKTLGISGTVTTAKGQPLAKRRVTLMFKDSSQQALDTITDSKGKFAFDNLAFTGNTEFNVQSFDTKGNNDVLVIIDSLPSQGVTKKNYHGGTTVQFSSVAMRNYLDAANKRFTAMKKSGQWTNTSKTLKEVFVDAKKKAKFDEALSPSANLNGPGKADQVLTYEDLRDCSDLGMCLQGKLLGVTFKYIFDSANRRKDIIPYSTRGFDRPMLVLFDGMEMDTKMGGLTLSTIAPSSVQSIEVLRSGSYLSSYGTRAASGVLVITSKRGGIDYEKPKAKQEKIKGVVFSTASGYTQLREFYSPDYSNTSARDSKAFQDLRSTICWNPNLVIDEDGKAAASFFTADVPGTYRVIVEGISDNGRLGRQVYTFSVQ